MQNPLRFKISRVHGYSYGTKNCTEEMNYAISNMIRTGMMQANVVIHLFISRSAVEKILKRSKDEEIVSRRKEVQNLN